jgi:opacity protein-like surface antigen
MRKTIAAFSLCAFLASGLALQAADDPQTAYFKFDVGVSLINDIDIRGLEGFNGFAADAKLKVDPGVRFDIAGGYNFTRELALEIETGFTFNRIKELEVMGVRGRVDADLFQVPILANLIYRLPLNSPFKPYIGGGAGGVFTIVSEEDITENDFTFAFQALAGVDYEINQNMDIGIGYKFLGNVKPELDGVELDNIYTHAILAVFRFRF